MVSIIPEKKGLFLGALERVLGAMMCFLDARENFLNAREFYVGDREPFQIARKYFMFSRKCFLGASERYLVPGYQGVFHRDQRAFPGCKGVILHDWPGYFQFRGTHNAKQALTSVCLVLPQKLL